MMKSTAHRTGAVLYIIWGLLHLKASYAVYSLGQSLEPGIVQGRVFQDAFSLLFFAAAGIFIAIRYNWNNSRLGYWMNLIIVSVTDIGFIFFILLPGYVPLIPGIAGPAVWLPAVVFTTIGYMNTD